MIKVGVQYIYLRMYVCIYIAVAISSSFFVIVDGRMENEEEDASLVFSWHHNKLEK